MVTAIFAAHAYFVASEYSLVTARKTRLAQLAADGNRAARFVIETLSRLQEVIAAVQLGTTMASLALGALAEPTVASLIEPALGFVPKGWQPVTAHGIAIAITFMLITSADIVLAELVPKTIALRHPEAVAVRVVRPLRLFISVFRPFISLLNYAGELVLRAIGFQSVREGDEAHSPEELKMLVAASRRAGVLDSDEQEMLDRVLEFSRIRVRQIMVPRTEIVALELGSDRTRIEEVIRGSRHTRFPVYRETLDEIVGILYVRDLLYRRFSNPSAQFDLTRLIRQPLSIPDSLPIDEVLSRMRRSRVHIGVVSDEFGGTAGIVTLEDILERIVGEVRDEFELPGESVTLLPQGDAVIDGLTRVADVNDRFEMELNEDEADTIGGLVMTMLGNVPQVGDAVDGDGFRLEVLEMDGRRVARVRLSRPQPSTNIA
jgi:CBS domain containing-hemolysin-like protein